MKKTNKPKRNKARNLTVQPLDAAKVKGGWFGVFLAAPQTTTKTTSTISVTRIDGESVDSKHKGEIE